MRERLIELILACDMENEVLVCFKERPKNRQAAEIIADHLLANGVIAPPVKVGDTVYGIATPCGGCKGFNEVMSEEYLKMCQKCDRFEILEIAFDYELIPEWGNTVFLTKAEAEKALAEGATDERAD